MKSIFTLDLVTFCKYSKKNGGNNDVRKLKFQTNEEIIPNCMLLSYHVRVSG